MGLSDYELERVYGIIVKLPGGLVKLLTCDVEVFAARYVHKLGKMRENGQYLSRGEDRRCLQSIATDCAGALATGVAEEGRRLLAEQDTSARPALARVGRLRSLVSFLLRECFGFDDWSSLEVPTFRPLITEFGGARPLSRLLSTDPSFHEISCG